MNEKVKGFFKNYLFILIALGISLAYIFRGFVTLDRTDKTVWTIIADGSLVLILGIVIDFLFGSQGIGHGKKVEKVVKSEERNEELIGKASPYMDKMQDFCDKKNVCALKNARRQIMLEKGYLAEDYFNDDGTVKPYPEVVGEDKKDAKRRKNTFRKARDFKITMLNIPLLTTDGAATKDPNAMGRSVNRFMMGQTGKDAASKVAFAIFWGLYGVKLVRDISWENLIATTLQVAMLIGIGAMKYITSKMYITGEYRDRVECKNRILEEFVYSMEEGKQDGTHEEQQKV